MKRYYIVIIALLLSACAPTAPMPTATPNPTSTATPSPTSTPIFTPTPEIIELAPDFVFQGDDPSVPFLTNNPSPEIENKYINPGGTIYHDGQFHMFFNSFTAWPGVIEVGYADSKDGLSWEMVQMEPVFTTDQIPYDAGKGDVSSVLVLDDGTWVFYFHTNGGAKQQIGRATAPSPLGPWTVDPKPVMTAGEAGSWDEKHVFWPNVVRDEAGFRMYYGAQNRKLQTVIGMATSSDGVTWAKLEAPVLIPEESWETTKVDRPRVQQTPDGWIMIYQGGANVEERGLAISPDGIEWEKYGANPFITGESFPVSSARTWDTSLLYHDGTYYYFMEIGTLAGTDLYLTTHSGSLIR